MAILFRLVCMENTQCACGGKALPMQWLKEVKNCYKRVKQ